MLPTWGHGSCSLVATPTPTLASTVSESSITLRSPSSFSIASCVVISRSNLSFAASRRVMALGESYSIFTLWPLCFS